ncbi:MAG TPA: hypothetical protein PKA82_17355, partial [Pyrinomonadaceae bacterium]|nr:hypothetical protein [Pyrinomonadaceae bacterium]
MRFNPKVLSGIRLPNGQAYSFKYNQWGEITTIVHPSGSIEKFEYGYILPLAASSTSAYDQANRGVKKHWIYKSEDHLSGYHEYSVTASTYPVNRYRITHRSNTGISASQLGMTSERDLIPGTAFGMQFGFENPTIGSVKELRNYDEGGTLRSRTLNKYIVADERLGGYQSGKRDARLEKIITVTIENDKALATLSEKTFDTNGHSNSEFFSHLNVKQAKSHHYRSIPLSLAETGTFEQIAAYFDSTSVASVSETDYLYDSNYQARGISSLPIETRVLNPANPDSSNIANVLGKTQTIYDNLTGSVAYPWTSPVQPQNGVPSPYDCGVSGVECWKDQNTNYFGRPTTSRVWVKESNTWIDSHIQYDQFGNAVKARDPIDNETTTEFSSAYKYAYPTKLTTPAPDLSNTTGTNQTSTVETTYDFNTGLPLTVKDDFGQITQTEYIDPLLRPTRVFPVNFTAPESQTEYGDTPGNLFVKVRKQLDGGNWAEATTFMDSLGRTVKTQARDSQGDVFVETHYDLLGRVERVTNPYRSGDTVYWSKTRYDVAGRAVETYAPAIIAEINTAATNNNANLTSLGVTSFAISDVTNFVGTVVTTKDASGRRGRSITNALEQLIRVDEPTGISSSETTDLGALATPVQATSYKYDVFGKMVQVTQGVQNRWFKYDALGRLLRVSQPEQERNPNLDLSDSYNTSGHWTAGFAYDLLGNVVRATDANGVNIINDYDRAGHVIRRCYTKPNINTSATTCAPIIGTSSESTDTAAVAFWYDGKGLAAPQDPNFAKGKLTKVSSSVSASEYQLFDSFGRVTQAAQITDGNTYASRYTYSFSGALVEEEYPSGRKVTNEFESDGDLAKVTSKKNSTSVNAPFVSNFSYTASGGISQMKLGNGRWETAKFNNRMQVTELGLG